MFVSNIEYSGNSSFAPFYKDRLILEDIHDVIKYFEMSDYFYKSKDDFEERVHNLHDSWESMALDDFMFSRVQADTSIELLIKVLNSERNLSSKRDSFVKLISNGMYIALSLVNGSYMCFEKADRNFKIIKSKAEYFSGELKENSKYINLENDPKLEIFTMDELSKIDENYSHILNLRHLSDNALRNTLKRFVKNGGDTVWQYTTGGDVEQMYSYSEIAIKAGVQHFIFYFNSGENEKIKDFISWLKRKRSMSKVEVKFI